MNQYLDKAGRPAGKTGKPFSVRSETLLSILCALALVFAACDTGTGSEETSSSSTSTGSRTAAESVTLLQKSLIVATADGDQTLEATVNPANARAKLTWTSDNNEIATVLAGENNTAVVTLKNPGTANITVKTDNGLSDTCVVTIKTVKSFTVVGGYREWYDPNEKYNYYTNENGLNADGTDQDLLILDVIYTDDTAQRGVKVKATTDNIKLPAGFEYLSGANTTAPTNPAGYSDPLDPLTNIGGTVGAHDVKTVGVIYGSVKQSFTVTKRSPRLITVVGKPTQLVYGVGENFNAAGLSLTAIYDVGPNKTGIPFPREYGIIPSDWNAAAYVGHVWIECFVINGIRTQASTNIASVNGQAGIYDGMPSSTWNPLGIDDGVQLAFWVAEVKGTGERYCGDALTTRFDELVEWSRGKEVTITIYDTNTGNRALSQPTGRPPLAACQESYILNRNQAGKTGTMALDVPGTDITIVGKGGVQRIGWSDAALDLLTVFHVSNGAKLTLGRDIRVSATSTGDTAPMVVVQGKDREGKSSQFIMEDGSFLSGMRTSRATDVAPLVIRDGAIATMYTGATISDNLIDSSGGNGDSFSTATGILVQIGGKLVMNGGTVSGVTTNCHGDVTLYGDLEIDGDARIGRLFLVTPQGPYSKPVTIKKDWNPTNITLRMGEPSVIEAGSVEIYPPFVGRRLFKGEGKDNPTDGAMEKIVGLDNNGQYCFIVGSGLVPRQIGGVRGILIAGTSNGITTTNGELRIE